MSDKRHKNSSITDNEARAAGSVVVGDVKYGGRKRRLLIIVTLCILILGLVGSGVYLWYRHGHPETPAPTKVVINLRPPTAEQRHLINDVIRADGTIISVTDNSVTFMLTGQSKPTVVQTDKTTRYMSGNRGFPSDRKALQVDHVATLSYNKGTNKASSIWVDYDVK